MVIYRGDDFWSDRPAICERVTRRQWRRWQIHAQRQLAPGREYVSTAVFKPVAGFHVGILAQIWPGIGWAWGLDGPEIQKVGE